MSSEIGNKNLLHRMGDYLQMLDPKTSPARLNVEEVQTVVSLGDVSSPGEGTPFLISGGGDISTATSQRIPLVMENMPAGFAPNGINAFRVDTISLLLSLDAAGAILMNNKKIDLTLDFQETDGDPGNTFNILQYRDWTLIQTGFLKYPWTLRGYAGDAVDTVQHGSSNWNGRIPALAGATSGFIGLSIEIVSRDGTAFPANTTILTQSMVRVSPTRICPAP